MARRPLPAALVLAAVLGAALAISGIARPAEAARQLATANVTASGKGGKTNGCCGHYEYSPPPPPPSSYYPSPPPPCPPSPPPPSYYSPPPPSYWNSPPPPTYWPYPDFPYEGCYYKSTGTYKIKFKGAWPSHDYTRYCFWVEAKYPDSHNYDKCRNFDLWSINFRVHIDCYDKVSYLTYNGQQLQPSWAPNLPPTKAMLQVKRGNNQVLDTQGSIASHKAEVCFTLPNYCPLDKFCKGDQCKAAFYSPPYSNLNCCPGWWCKSHWWEGR